MAEETKRRVMVAIALILGCAAAVACGVLAQSGPGEPIPLYADLVRRGELEATLMRYALWAVIANAVLAGGLIWRDGARHSAIKGLRDEVKQLRSEMWMDPT